MQRDDIKVSNILLIFATSTKDGQNNLYKMLALEMNQHWFDHVYSTILTIWYTKMQELYWYGLILVNTSRSIVIFTAMFIPGRHFKAILTSVLMVQPWPFPFLSFSTIKFYYWWNCALLGLLYKKSGNCKKKYCSWFTIIVVLQPSDWTCIII